MFLYYELIRQGSRTQHHIIMAKDDNGFTLVNFKLLVRGSFHAGLKIQNI
jgi:hypothetical protein